MLTYLSLFYAFLFIVRYYYTHFKKEGIETEVGKIVTCLRTHAKLVLEPNAQNLGVTIFSLGE